MHVCIAGSKSCPPRIGGIEVFSFELGRRLASRGIGTTIITSRWPGEKNEERLLGMDVRRVWTVHERHLFKISTLPSLLRMARKLDFDIFHANDPVSGLVPTLTSIGNESVLTVHGLGVTPHEWSTPYRQIGLLLQKRAVTGNAVVTTTDSRTASQFKSLRNDVKIIPTGVDTDKFKERAHSRPESYSDSQTNILFAGRLTSVKGFDLLIDCIRELPPEVRAGIKITVIGTGPLEKLIGSSDDVGKTINWVGEIPHEQIPPYFTHADLFLMPSRSEGMPISMLEAMSAGLPVVATSVGGIASQFDDRHFTRIEDFTPRAVADAIVKALADKSSSKVKARVAEDLVRKEYSWETVADRYVALYEQIASSRGPTHS